MFGEDTFVMLKFKLKGKDYTIEEIVKIIDEVESLREENAMLNKDRSALHEIVEGLQNKVKNLKQQVSNLEEIIQDDMGAQSDEIHNLKVDIDSLEKAYAELLGLFHGKLDEVKDQQAVIEFQKNDIERLVKLNAELQKQLDDYKKGVYFSIYPVR